MGLAEPLDLVGEDLNASLPAAARGALEVAEPATVKLPVERAHGAGGLRDMVEWRRSGHVLGCPLPRHFDQRLRFVTFEALELGNLRSGELVGHLTPGLGGVVGCGHVCGLCGRAAVGESRMSCLGSICRCGGGALE